MKQVIQENRFFPIDNDNNPRVGKEYNYTWKGATDEFDPNERQGWWTGKGIFVIDVDIKNGKDGRKWTKYSDLPPTHVVRTQNGGEHWYYWYDEDVKIKVSKNDPYEGIDIRGDNGFVAYYYDLPYFECSKAPAWLLATVKCEERTYVSTHSTDDKPDEEEYERIKQVFWSDGYDYNDYNEGLFLSACVFKSTGHENAFEDWISWHSQSPKFNKRKSVKQWNHIKEIPEGYTWRSALKIGSDKGILDELAGLDIDVPFFSEFEDDNQKNKIQTIPEHLLTFPVPILEELNQFFKDSTTNAHPEISVAGVLALVATLAGRNFKSRNNNYTSLFITVLAGSSVGKNFIQESIKTVLDQAGYLELDADELYRSAQSIPWTLFRQPNHIIFADEFGRTIEEGFKNKNSHTEGIFTKLMRIHGACNTHIKLGNYSLRGMSDKEKEILANGVVHCPCVNMIALTTPDRYWDALTESHAKDGFLNRQILVQVTHKIESVFGIISNQSLSKHVLKWAIDMRYWIKPVGEEYKGGLKPEQRIVEFDQDALDVFAEAQHFADQKIEEYEETPYSKWFGRMKENAMRIATALAVADGIQMNKPLFIEEKHARWAWDYSRHYTMNALYIAKEQLGSTRYKRDYDSLLQGIYSHLRSAGKPLTKRTLRRKSPCNNPKPNELTEFLRDMVDRGDLIAERIKNEKNGKESIFYSLPTNLGLEND